LIALLRDPIDRAHSNWTHLWSAGLEPERDFLRACLLEQERAADGWAHFWRYLGLGRYGEQLTALYDVFPPEQVLVLRYKELRDAPVAAMNRICAFLGVEQGQLGELPVENVTAHAGDVQLLEALVGESFQDWIDPHRPDPRAALDPTGRIGTAHGSIDHPLSD